MEISERHYLLGSSTFESGPEFEAYGRSALLGILRKRLRFIDSRDFGFGDVFLRLSFDIEGSIYPNKIKHLVRIQHNRRHKVVSIIIGIKFSEIDMPVLEFTRTVEERILEGCSEVSKRMIKDGRPINRQEFIKCVAEALAYWEDIASQGEQSDARSHWLHIANTIGLNSKLGE